ncbi:MAG: methyl-accepting chemotaxis protein [Hydrococcus sp. Prado102]|nr:methyl-accepting chemotaxis protein [Hydrococcus sp. Prado102]
MTTTLDKLSNTQPQNGLGLKKLLSERVVEIISVALLVTLALFGVSSWTIWNIYQGFRDKVTEQFRLKELIGNATYHDESLGLGAYMYVTTGESQWLDYYRKAEPLLNQTIEELIQVSPQAKADFAQTEAATAKLYELEVRAFELVSQGKKEQAQKIVFGQEYGEQRQIYAAGIQNTLTNLKTSVDKELESYRQALFQSLIFAAISLPLLVLAWVVIFWAVRTYTQERNKAQNGLMESQASLQRLNEELEGRVEQRTKQLAEQEQATREESEVLQVDVVNLLDVVSEVEGGDLTVQAPVSDRVTGLVADTFNRLTEELAKVLGQVVGASRQVSQSAINLEEIAATVATNAEQQAQGVTQALTLSEQVEHSAQNATQQVQISNQALLDLSATVLDGQTAMTGLTQGTEILRQGSDRIVQQMKTLGEFVGLAEQFVRDQSQIASQTQVLALNASLVAARAAEQQNPRQFLVAAKEFEAIADQVSKLAQLTNDGLSVLEQRTTQIQNVVSMVDAEVQNLGGLVGGFTQGVEQSTQVFDSVQLVATDAVRSGEAVSELNQEIISSVQSTATAMRSIADIAQRTAQLTLNARSQSEAMGQLSTQLLERVEFFRLPEEAIQQQEPSDLARSQENTIDVAIAK